MFILFGIIIYDDNFIVIRMMILVVMLPIFVSFYNVSKNVDLIKTKEEVLKILIYEFGLFMGIFFLVLIIDRISNFKINLIYVYMLNSVTVYIVVMSYLIYVVRKVFKKMLSNIDNRLKEKKEKFQLTFLVNQLSWIVTTLTFLGILLLGSNAINSAHSEPSIFVDIFYYILLPVISINISFLYFIYKFKLDIYNI